MSSDLDVHSALRGSLHELLSGGDRRDVRDWDCRGRSRTRGTSPRRWSRRAGLSGRGRRRAIGAALRCASWGGLGWSPEPLSSVWVHSVDSGTLSVRNLKPGLGCMRTALSALAVVSLFNPSLCDCTGSCTRARMLLVELLGKADTKERKAEAILWKTESA